MIYNLENIIGSVFETKKYGLVTVLEVCGKELKYDSKCKIRFLKTNSERYISYANLRLGNVKDFEAKIICGIACKGNIYVPNGSYTRKIYELWKVLIGRCYNKKFKAYSLYGAKGVKVCDEWLNFSNFYKEHTEIEGYNLEEYIKGNLVLDKDIKQINLERFERVYSKNTCKWVTQQENNKYQELNSIKIEYKGKKYNSKIEMRREFNIGEKSQQKMLTDENFKPLKHNHKVFYEGIEYYSKAEMRRKLKISEGKQKKLISEGLAIQVGGL